MPFSHNWSFLALTTNGRERTAGGGCPNESKREYGDEWWVPAALSQPFVAWSISGVDVQLQAGLDDLPQVVHDGLKLRPLLVVDPAVLGHGHQALDAVGLLELAQT